MTPEWRLSHRRLPGIAILCLAALTLSACQPPPITIALKEFEGQTIAILSQDWGFLFSDIEPPCVTQVQLISDENHRRPVWSISSLPTQDGSCRELVGFSVGETPEGYEQEIALNAEASGAFLLTVDGVGYGEAEITLN